MPVFSYVARNLQWGGWWGFLGGVWDQKKGLHLKMERFLHQNSTEAPPKKQGLHLKMGFLRPNSSKDSARISV